ncbi:hypothetical protein T265_09440 [Opisthorchis viverrini]|uniref:Uncharacterized protein n=1 Tax=Opisthorchis viverrini TaxID=6198 RepID=A0A074Z5Q0_OPIVI|nr:hypothetical protein T265_09440 [Opisthorchis viverrini]KER22461.1 hypothetical protein T265_09440 [Opisthorchis viverrini]
MLRFIPCLSSKATQCLLISNFQFQVYDGIAVRMKEEFASYESHKANNSGSIVSGFLMTAVSWKRPLFGLWFDSVTHEKISGNVGSYFIVETPTINLIRPEGHTSLQGNVKDVPSMTQSGKPLHDTVGPIFDILQYIFIKETAHKVAETSSKPTTGFALLRAHQVGAVSEFPSNLCSNLTRIGLFLRSTFIRKSIWFSRETQLNLSFMIIYKCAYLMSPMKSETGPVMGGAEQMFVFETFFTNVPTLVNFTRAVKSDNFVAIITTIDSLFLLSSASYGLWVYGHIKPQILVESLLCFAISIFVYVAALKAPIECCKMIEPDLKSGCPNQFIRTNSYFFNGCESNLRQYLHEHIPVIVYASLSVLPLDALDVARAPE